MTVITKGTPVTRSAALGLVVMFVLLATGVAFNYFGTQSAIRHATAAAATTAALCQSINVSRAKQRLLWDHILTISATSQQPRETAAQKRQRLATARAFEAYVHHVFAPKNCAAITR